MFFGVIIRLLVAIALSAVVAVSAQAETAPSDENGRFLLRKAEDGWFRVDQRTGQASLCREGGVGFTCELVPDDRDALLDEITRLAEENAMLRAQVAKGGKPELPGEPDAKTRDDGIKLPSKEDLDKVMDTFRAMMERFMAMVKDLEKQYSGEPKQ